METDMQTRMPRRAYTVMRNLAVAFVVTLASFMGMCLFAVMRAFPSSTSGFGRVAVEVFGAPCFFGLVLGAIGSVAAPVLGLLFPVKTYKPISNGRRYFALLGWLGALEAIAVLFVGVSMGYGIYMSGRKVDATFADRRAMERDRVARRFPLDHLMPKEARDISFKGGTGIAGLGWNAEFSCRVSEPEFEAFAASHNWRLATNRFENANAATSDHTPDNPFWGNSEMENPFLGADPPKRFVSYYYLKSNFGNTCLALDLETGILYGQYSSN